MKCHLSIALILIFVYFIKGQAAERENRVEDVKILCYYSQFEHYEEVDLFRSSDVLSLDCFNASQSTILYAHGYKGYRRGVAVTAMIKAYLTHKDKNVLLLDWSNMASSDGHSIVTGYLKNAAPNTRKVGQALGDQIKLWVDAGFDVSSLHVIGHSLGAHLLGFCGEHLNTMDIILPRITGLDPAHEGFEPSAFGGCLDSSDAHYVDIIHSNPAKYGSRIPHGSADFWPNYNSSAKGVQPGCSRKPSHMFTEQDLCSHNRAWQFWIESLFSRRNFLAIRARHYKEFSSKRFQHTNARDMVDTNFLGPQCSQTLRGNFFLFTNTDHPYGLGENGIFV